MPQPTPAPSKPFKIPRSVLVLIHTAALDVLLIRRADIEAEFWQSVTGSQEGDETLRETARREVQEETGLNLPDTALHDWQQTNVYEIFPEWRHRYAPGVTHNTEHVFSLEVPLGQPIRIAPDEHLGFCWRPWREAAEQCFSWSNRNAILMLPERCAR